MLGRCEAARGLSACCTWEVCQYQPEALQRPLLLAFQVQNSSVVTESVSLAVEAFGTERVDRNLVTAYQPSVLPHEADGRRELREIFRHHTTVVVKGLVIAPGAIRSWIIRCSPCLHCIASLHEHRGTTDDIP